MKKTIACLFSFAALTTGGVGFAATANATPGYGSDCQVPWVNTCRLMPDANGPHDIERWCPGQGYINIYAVCNNRFGPYSQ